MRERRAASAFARLAGKVRPAFDDFEGIRARTSTSGNLCVSMSLKKLKRWSPATSTARSAAMWSSRREGSGYRSDCTLRLSSGVSLHAEGRGARALSLLRTGRRQDRAPPAPLQEAPQGSRRALASDAGAARSPIMSSSRRTGRGRAGRGLQSRRRGGGNGRAQNPVGRLRRRRTRSYRTPRWWSFSMPAAAG